MQISHYPFLVWEWLKKKKKQSFRSTTISFQFIGIMEGKGIPGCKGPIGCITLLTALNLLTYTIYQISF